jgi:hypothetical protein
MWNSKKEFQKHKQTLAQPQQTILPDVADISSQSHDMKQNGAVPLANGITGNKVTSPPGAPPSRPPLPKQESIEKYRKRPSFDSEPNHHR